MAQIQNCVAVADFDPVAHRDNGIKVVVLNTSRYIARTFASNYPESPDSCLFLQLTARKYVGQVLGNGTHIYIE